MKSERGTSIWFAVLISVRYIGHNFFFFLNQSEKNIIKLIKKKKEKSVLCTKHTNCSKNLPKFQEIQTKNSKKTCKNNNGGRSKATSNYFTTFFFFLHALQLL
jgi:hypothetical protein